MSTLSALIVGSGPDIVDGPHLCELAKAADLVIAADAGAAPLLLAGIPIDLLVGDLDSIAPDVLASLEAAPTTIETHPAEKDVTDLDLAIAAARARGVVTAAFTGVTGGELGHALAAIGSIARAGDLEPVIVAPQWSAVVLCADAANEVALGPETEFSVIAVLGGAVVECFGARWDIHSQTMVDMDSLGVGNRVQDAEAIVRVIDGTVLVVLRDV